MEPFKNFISPELMRLLAEHLARHSEGVDPVRLSRSIARKLGPLELKERVQYVADCLTEVLPTNTAERAAVLLAMLRPEVADGESQESDEQGIAGWGVWPLTQIVGQHGSDDFDGSMALLREMTKRSTSEFAVRYFLIQDQARALSIITGWVDDPNHHVRRLVSEGTRPRLPWANQLPQLRADPLPVIPLLERLRDDPSEYVRRSVANHLNDITKDNPKLALKLFKQWMHRAPEPRKKLLKHASRGLLKAGDPTAMGVFGFAQPQLKVDAIKLVRKRVLIGEKLDFSVSIHSAATTSQKLSIDYVVHLLRSNGTLSPKVFKGSAVELAAGQTMMFSRSHSLRPVTTRRYYPGEHALSLRINGVDTPSIKFHLGPALTP